MNDQSNLPNVEVDVEKLDLTPDENLLQEVNAIGVEYGAGASAQFRVALRCAQYVDARLINSKNAGAIYQQFFAASKGWPVDCDAIKLKVPTDSWKVQVSKLRQVLIAAAAHPPKMYEDMVQHGMAHGFSDLLDKAITWHQNAKDIPELSEQLKYESTYESIVDVARAQNNADKEAKKNGGLGRLISEDEAHNAMLSPEKKPSKIKAAWEILLSVADTMGNLKAGKPGKDENTWDREPVTDEGVIAFLDAIANNAIEAATMLDGAAVTAKFAADKAEAEAKQKREADKAKREQEKAEAAAIKAKQEAEAAANAATEAKPAKKPAAKKAKKTEDADVAAALITLQSNPKLAALLKAALAA